MSGSKVPPIASYLVQQRYTHASLDVLMTLPISSKFRDQLGMVVYPGQAGATVTRGCAGLNWLGGERMMGEGRFATSREIAGFMGISSRLGPYCVALRHYSDYQVYAACSPRPFTPRCPTLSLLWHPISCHARPPPWARCIRGRSISWAPGASVSFRVLNAPLSLSPILLSYVYSGSPLVQT